MQLALDLTHSSHSPAQTGIQQVARGLWRELPPFIDVESVVFDKYADFWRPIDRREHQHLQSVDQREKVKRKRPHWSTWQRIRGRWQCRSGARSPRPEHFYDAALLPEFFAEWVGPRLPELRRLTRGPMVAVFHDAIAFHEPAWGVRETIARYPQYLRELASLDGIACVSAFSRGQLLEAFDRIGVSSTARIETVPLGLRTDHLPPVEASPGKETSDRFPTFLAVATIEPRKNHTALLAAAETLWKEGHVFELTLVGMLNRGSGQPIEKTLRRLQAEGRALRWHGSVSADDLARLYQTCDATVFPSHCEGFGLPVLESLYFQKPCIASNGGALAEVATGPGVLSGTPDAASVADNMRRFLIEPGVRERLTCEASERAIRTMRDYARDVAAFVQDTTRSAASRP